MRRILVTAMATVVGVGLLGAASAADAAGGPFAGSSPPVATLPVPADGELLGDDGRDHLLSRVQQGDGAAWRWYDVDVAARTRVEIPAPGPSPSCVVDAAGPGGLAGRCGVGQHFLSAFPFDGWRPAPLPLAASQNSQGTAYEVLAIGSHWLWLRMDGKNHPVTVYSSRDDGRTVLGDGALAAGLVDLDLPGLTVVPCPLTLPARGHVVAYDRPWALVAQAGTRASRHRPTLFAQRCGSRTRTVLTRGGVVSLSLHGRVATWVKGRVGHVRNLKTGAARTVRVPGHRIAFRSLGGHVLVLRDPKDVSGASMASAVGVVTLPRALR